MCVSFALCGCVPATRSLVEGKCYPQVDRSSETVTLMAPTGVFGGRVLAPGDSTLMINVESRANRPSIHFWYDINELIIYTKSYGIHPSLRPSRTSPIAVDRALRAGDRQSHPNLSIFRHHSHQLLHWVLSIPLAGSLRVCTTSPLVLTKSNAGCPKRSEIPTSSFVCNGNTVLIVCRGIFGKNTVGSFLK